MINNYIFSASVNAEKYFLAYLTLEQKQDEKIMRLNTFKIRWNICIKGQNESDTNDSLVPLHIFSSEGIRFCEKN